MTPSEELAFLRPAFLNLFSDEKPDLDRFVRLVADVLDPCQGYGPSKCSGLNLGGEKPLVIGCGKIVTFQVASDNGNPYGFKCPECEAVYPWSVCKGPKPAASRIVITSSGNTIGSTRSESDSGVVIVDNGTVKMPA